MKKTTRFFIPVGIVLISLAIFLAGYNIWQDSEADFYAEQTAIELTAQIRADDDLEEDAEDVPDYILNPEMDMPVVEMNGREYIGTLEISSYDLQLPILSEWSYAGLRKSPARYEGSVYSGDLIIAGHNFRRHFRNLKNLKMGTEIIFTDADGNVFRYEVVELEILKPTAVEEIHEGDWDMTLFTCTIGGRSRVVIRCECTEGLRFCE